MRMSGGSCSPGTRVANTPAEGMLPFTEEGKRSLELSLAEMQRVDDARIETEHLLLALLRPISRTWSGCWRL